MNDNCILWVKRNKEWPESRQGTWRQAGIGNDDPDGWLLNERLKEMNPHIYDWKIVSYPTYRGALDAAFSNPLTFEEVRPSASTLSDEELVKIKRESGGWKDE